MAGEPPPLKVAGTGMVANLLEGLADGRVTVNEMLGSLDNELETDAKLITFRRKPALPPARLAQRYFGPTKTHRRGEREYNAAMAQCSRCAVLDLQVRAVIQSLVGLSTYFTNWSLNRPDTSDQSELLNTCLSYLQPLAHLGEDIAEACLGLRTAVATVGEPVDPTQSTKPLPMKVNIVCANGLAPIDELGLADAYCVCEVAGDPGLKFKTDVINDTLDPNWNHIEEIEYEPGSDIRFAVWHNDVTGHETLGHALLTASEVFPQGYEGTLELENTGLPTGDATIDIKVEFPSLEQWLSWPPTIVGMTTQLMKTRARALDSEKQLEATKTGTPPRRSQQTLLSKRTRKSKQTAASEHTFIRGPQPLSEDEYSDATGTALESEEEESEEEPPTPPPRPPVAGGRRMDPADKKFYTAKELKEKYKGTLSPLEMKEYWENRCIPEDERQRQNQPRTRNEALHAAAPPFFRDGHSSVMPESYASGSLGRPPGLSPEALQAGGFSAEADGAPPRSAAMSGKSRSGFSKRADGRKNKTEDTCTRESELDMWF